jgi:hypothetical protein
LRAEPVKLLFRVVLCIHLLSVSRAELGLHLFLLSTTGALKRCSVGSTHNLTLLSHIGDVLQRGHLASVVLRLSLLSLLCGGEAELLLGLTRRSLQLTDISNVLHLLACQLTSGLAEITVLSTTL